MDNIEALLTIVAVTAVFLGLLFFVRNYVVKRRIVCPKKHKRVDVEFVCKGGSREKAVPFRVKSCSAFPNPRKIDCDEECLHEEAPKHEPEHEKA